MAEERNSLLSMSEAEKIATRERITYFENTLLDLEKMKEGGIDVEDLLTRTRKALTQQQALYSVFIGKE